MRYYLNFKSDNYGKKLIDEPIGIDGLVLSLKQKDNGYARDISGTGSETDLRFTTYSKHELKQLLYYNRKFGFEAIVELTIEINESKLVYELDFATAETDDITYFKCKGIQDGKLQLLKRRETVKVDLLSSLDVDGNFIQPCLVENMLNLAKPVVQVSKWEQSTDFNDRFFAQNSSNNIESTAFYQLNPSQNLVSYSLEDSFTFFDTFTKKLGFEYTESQYQLIKAKENLTNVKVSVKDLLIHFDTDVDNGGNGFVEFSLELKYGTTYESATKVDLFTPVSRSENQSFDFAGDCFYTINQLNRDDSIWLYFRSKVRQSATSVGISARFEQFLSVKNMKTTIEASSTSYNSVNKSIRLIDAINQVVKSTTGLKVVAPRFELGGEFYDNRLLNGKFLRNIYGQFVASLEDIKNSLKEVNADYEIDSNGNVFFGIYDDFYNNIESGFFDNVQFSEMNKTFNPKYMINEFYYKYEKYQAKKENEELNSADNIHGETNLVFYNKSVENKKEVAIKWIRDPFLIESTRRKGLVITKETGSQDDDDLFAIDSITTENDLSITEVTVLDHKYNTTIGKLVLQNNGTIDFILLGIQVGNTLSIIAPDFNAGNYTVFEVTQNIITLTKISGINYSAGNGIRSTKYVYQIKKELIPYTNYTNEGFSETENLNAPESYSNKRYSVSRNIYNYWQKYLATANLYWNNKPIKNSLYKNNGEYKAKYNGIKLKENADLMPINPILSPVLYNEIIFKNVSFNSFINLINEIRFNRGFIRCLDNDNQVFRIYPLSIDYTMSEKELSIKGEEKFIATKLNIVTLDGYVVLNDEVRTDIIEFDFDKEKLNIYDSNRFRLYSGIYWQEVSVNSAIPNTKNQLIGWLNLI